MTVSVRRTVQLNHSLAISTGRKAYELRFNGRSYFASATWVPYERREVQRLQLEDENDEQTSHNLLLL